MAGERQTEPHQAERERALQRIVADGSMKISDLTAELARVRAERDDLREQIDWTVQRCNTAMGDGFKGTPNSAVAAVCDALNAAEARAENQAAEIVETLRAKAHYIGPHIRDSIGIHAAADFIEREFPRPTDSDRTENG